MNCDSRRHYVPYGNLPARDWELNVPQATMTGGLQWVFSCHSLSSNSALLGGNLRVCSILPLFEVRDHVRRAPDYGHQLESQLLLRIFNRTVDPFDHMIIEVRGYSIRACHLARFQWRKRLLKFTWGEGLFDLLPRGCTCGSFWAS